MTKAVILAAGKGVRMKSDLPKVLHPLGGIPLLVHVIRSLREAGIDDIITVVGYRGDEVARAAGEGVRVVWQHEQKGTGHAVMQAEPLLADYRGLVVIACGDVPLISPKTVREMVIAAREPGVKACVLSMTPPDPFGYGRILKEPDGTLVRIVEEKDAGEEEKRIREVNTGTYVFHSEFLFPGLKTITTNNAQGEYYLPDVFNYIRSSGFKTRAMMLADPIEGSGINSTEDLKVLEARIESRKGAEIK
ncbi:MAG: UDP-N-acetylglucosamine diphosphorylase [Spirochaetes bacterium]|nr:MAG: UDP-N-acetylglucosamine diphosphorylase [Spirochaetota bacterium]